MPSATDKKSNASEAAETTVYEYTVDRYYYTPHRRFEQSLDVYTPVKSSSSCDHETNTKEQGQAPKIPVVLVMGSGWLGHKPYFYLMTNWWNSSAPKQICGRLGHPCISIRHSGGYLFGKKTRSFPSVFVKPFWLVAAMALAMMAGSLNLSPSTGSLPFVPAALFRLLLLVVLYVEGMGAAGIDDMVSDVSSALSYIDEHAHEWGLGETGVETTTTEDSPNQKRIPVVFGGYSSGAHVAATLLTASPLSPLRSTKTPLSSTKLKETQQQNELRPQRPKHLVIRSILYISGVLDVPPESVLMTLLSRLVLGRPPSQVPSPLRTLSSVSPSPMNGNKSGIGTCKGGHDSDLQHKAVVSTELPPHVLIGCKREVFGWSILDSAFCIGEYAEALWSYKSKYEHADNGSGEDDDDKKKKKSFVRLILLEDWTVNHWSILSSTALRNALRPVLAQAGTDETGR